MVKITDPFKENKERKNVSHMDTDPDTPNNPNIKFTDKQIKEMLKPESKQKTTQVNLRLETSITDQLKVYAKEHDTTMTEIIKDIITEYYQNKKINKSTFKLKEPVNLIIPKSKTLLHEYIENEVNIVSSIKQYGTQVNINPLDPHINTYETSTGGYELIHITQANNILDVFDQDNKCYRFRLDDGFFGDPVNDTETFDKDQYTYSFHRGLLMVNIPSFMYDKPEDSLETLLIDILVSDGYLIKASIITKGRAIELARKTGNMELIGFIRSIDEYTYISELVKYDNTNRELTKENHEIKQTITALIDENETLKLENESLNEEIKNNFTEVKNDDYNKYVEGIEHENKELKDRVRALELQEDERTQKIDKLYQMLSEYMEYTKQ